jgi:fumigallin biosynthesis monooxygenase-like protein
MPVHTGRHAARIQGDFVVFLIGMRVNKPWKLREWLFVFRAMPRMIKELEADPESGFLGATQGLWTTGPALVQYWRSFEHLERYARDPEAEHFPVWREFNRRIRDSGDVGIWHETYRVGPGDSESIYSNMPRVGLAAIGEHRPIGSTSQTAPMRIGAVEADEPPVAPY